MNCGAGAKQIQQLFSLFTIPYLHRPQSRVHLRFSCMAESIDRGVSLSNALWAKHRSEAARALYHPFVVSLAAGVLDIRSFRNYIAQDAFFLKSYSTLYQFARDNIDDHACKLTAEDLLRSAVGESHLHSTYAQAWGLDLNTAIHPNNATTKYTQFLLATASVEESTKGERTVSDRQRSAAFTIGAMTPCMRLYAFLGQQTRKHLGAGLSDTPYHDWIETYSSESFQLSTVKIEGLLDSLAAHLDEDDLAKLENLYSQACTLELEFFSEQPHCHCPVLPFIRQKVDHSDTNYLVMADFDLTCSVTDSCSVLASISKHAATVVSEDNNLQPHHKSASELKRRWDVLEKSYSEHYSKISVPPLGQENFEGHCDFDGLRSFLVQLSDFEIQSNEEIIRQGVFDGLKPGDAWKAGHDMTLQEGCSEFFQHLSSLNNVDAHIISVCWSESLVKGALAKEGLELVEVHANELIKGGSGTSGGIKRLVETPFDKEKVLKELIRNAGSLSKPVQSIYIGDSVTDILGLLEADLGIVIGSNPTLKKVAKAFGVVMVPLYEATLKMAKSGNPQDKNDRMLYTVADWHEIRAFLTA